MLVPSASLVLGHDGPVMWLNRVRNCWLTGRWNGRKGATGLEPARSTCGSVGPLGDLVVGIGDSLTREGEEGCIGGSEVGGRVRACSIC